jgi:hypothetical protein
MLLNVFLSQLLPFGGKTMVKKPVFVTIAAILVMGGVFLGEPGGHPASAGPSPDAGGISYASLPDEAALYLNDMVFVRDSVTLPDENVRVLLPPGTYANTLILTENGERVQHYRVTPQSSDVYYSQAAFRYGSPSYGGGGTAYIVTWESSATETREIKLEYLMSGASWTPNYDMQIVDNETVQLAFFAEIHTTALVLDEATVYLVAGRVDLSQQVDQAGMVTMNQYAVGYEGRVVDLPSLGVGSVNLQHIYPVGQVSAEPGDMVYVNLVDGTFAARRLVVWNASTDAETDVIYKVLNSTETPLAEGIVRTYQDKLFVGSDFIETTPPGSEGSVTVGSLPDVRVHRTESKEYHGEERDDYYQHSVELQIENFGEEALDLIILDRWEENAWQFEYWLEPVRQQDNLLRWEVSLPAGGQLTITYQYRTEY